jgi:hypothetical protein
VISYRELRLLELEILRTVLALQEGQPLVEVFGLVKTDVDQFYRIELEEFPAQIAQVALWLMDHQMNLRVSEEFGMYFARLPLKKSPTVVHGNAPQLDWADVVPPEKLSFILGNPPFVGSKYQSDPQRAEITGLFRGIPGAGILDCVSGCYIKAANYIRAGDPEAAARIRCALVSTNSITQGEQAGVLWPELLRRGAHIHFAHSAFRWSNEARGIAAVHCVIVGFAFRDAARKTIFDYDDPRGEPHAQPAANINPCRPPSPGRIRPWTGRWTLPTWRGQKQRGSPTTPSASPSCSGSTSSTSACCRPLPRNAAPRNAPRERGDSPAELGESSPPVTG